MSYGYTKTMDTLFYSSIESLCLNPHHRCPLWKGFMCKNSKPLGRRPRRVEDGEASGNAVFWAPAVGYLNIFDFGFLDADLAGKFLLNIISQLFSYFS